MHTRTPTRCSECVRRAIRCDSEYICYHDACLPIRELYIRLAGEYFGHQGLRYTKCTYVAEIIRKSGWYHTRTPARCSESVRRAIRCDFEYICYHDACIPKYELYEPRAAMFLCIECFDIPRAHMCSTPQIRVAVLYQEPCTL